MRNKLYWLILIIITAFTTDCTAQKLSLQTRKVKENLNRGVVAIRKDEDSINISWRFLSSDSPDTRFNVYRNGTKIITTDKNQGTFVTDKWTAKSDAEYKIIPVINGKEDDKTTGHYILKSNSPIGYIDIPLKKPANGRTPINEEYFYIANDASVGDVDGDGEYEIILKWSPSNAKDNSHDGYTGNVLIDCYKLDGRMLWRIDLGRNIRAGAHYTPFIVYDLDCDGKAEIIMRTSDGTKDGKGHIIGDSTADYRYSGDLNGNNDNRIRRYPERVARKQGRIMEGNEYLTVFCGMTGEELYTTDYYPPRGNIMDWGDDRANRSDRFLACVAYLDGEYPSIIFCRGYYTRIVLAAYNWNGKELKNKWIFDSNDKGNEAYAGQGNHNLRVGDVDDDGMDEIVYGQCTIDHDGKGLYSTGLGHGDALHMTQFAPDMSGMQVWGCHENRRDGSTFRDAKTGKIIWQLKDNSDVGRCMAADIDPTNWGVEMWSSKSGGIRNIAGDVVANARIPINMAVWWDGDLLRELLDKNMVIKYDWKEKVGKTMAVFEGTRWNNGTKSNPCLQADIIGDWREEVIMRSDDNQHLRIYATDFPTDYRFSSFMEDPVYRISVATENVGYNQPTQLGFYFGSDMKMPR